MLTVSYPGKATECSRVRNICNKDQCSKGVQDFLCFMMRKYCVQSSSVQPDDTGREESTEKCTRNSAA